MRAQFLLDAEQFDEAKVTLETLRGSTSQDSRLMFTLKDYYLQNRRMGVLKSAAIAVRKKRAYKTGRAA